MDFSQEDAIYSIDRLFTASNKFEEQLEKDGISQAHSWMFAIREVLLDIRRVNSLLADMYNESDVHKIPLLLQQFVRTYLYEVIPHVQSHMSELEESLSVFLPEPDSSQEDAQE